MQHPERPLNTGEMRWVSYYISITSSLLIELFPLCLPSMFTFFSCRTFYIHKKNVNTTARVYVGLGSDPRTNHVLYADFPVPAMRQDIHHISISTASDCIGEWQFATGTRFKYSNVKIVLETPDKQKAN